MIRRTDAAAGGYIGCYENDGEERDSGHTGKEGGSAGGLSYAACEALAQAQGNTFFGLEFPQGYNTAGNAQCLPLGAIPSMQTVADSDCEAEVFNGTRLGSGHRLAVYSLGTSKHPGSQTLSSKFPPKLPSSPPCRVTRGLRCHILAYSNYKLLDLARQTVLRHNIFLCIGTVSFCT